MKTQSPLKNMAAAASIFFFLLILRPTAAQPPAGELPDYARVTPSMAIIIVVLIAALFLMGFFSIYIRNCSESQSTVGGSIRQLGRRAVAASRGLDPSVIETFPTMVYSAVKGLKIGKGALECAVCLNEFEDDETLRLIPKCDHVFHPECIDAWLESHTTCPVCRANLTPDQTGDESPVPPQVEPETMAPPLVTRAASDLEAGRVDGAVLEDCGNEDRPTVEAGSAGSEVAWVDRVLNRTRTTRGSRSGRVLRKFPRSHSTGHSLVQPGENTDRFTLRLPADVRKQVMKQGLNRSSSMVMLPREGSTRRGYRTGGGGEGSSRGKHSSYKRLEPLETSTEGGAGRSDRWVFNRTSSFFARASSFLTRTGSTVRSPRVAANDGSIRSPRDQGEGSSSKPSGSEATTQLTRPPV